MRSSEFRRLRFLSGLVIFIALLLVGRLFFLQVIHGSDYRLLGDRQYTSLSSLPYDRGNIYFREKGGQLVSAASLKSGFLVAINPKLITDPEEVYRKVASVPGVVLDQDDFLKRAGKKDDPYEVVLNQLSESQAKLIRDLDLVGVMVYRERWRFYPAGATAAHVLGLVGYQNDEYAGRYGLERYYDQTLSRNTDRLYNNFFAELFLGVTDLAQGKARLQGDLVTTIEPQLQTFLESKLDDLVEKWQAELAGGIIMDPSTGEIVAAAVSPDFDPGNFTQERDNSVFSNPLVERVYEMGSIVKPLTMAAGLDAGVVTPETTYNDRGSVKVGIATISNFDAEARGVVPMQEVLNQSLNTGAVFVMQKLGKEKFRDYMLGFGLGAKTGVDLPGEVAGLVANLNSSREVEYATAAFGQGIALTPLGMTRALAALGNGGYLVQPYVVDEIEYAPGVTRTLEHAKGKQVIKSETSEEISRMLSKVYDNALMGGIYKIPSHTVAAKTGTAQIAKEGELGYYDDRYLHSFFGYLPAFNPRFITFLYLVEPRGVRYASHSLSLSFVDITKFLISYYEIPPDR